MKYTFFIFISFLFFSCGASKKDNLSLIDFPIPQDWESKIPISDNFTGEWWRAFEDTTLEKFISEIRLGNPNLKSIIHKREMALQTAKINGASIFPNINSSINNNNSVQNLVNFGFAESFFGNNSNDEVTTFNSETYGLNLSLQWEIDIWGRAINSRRAAFKDFKAKNYELSYLGFSVVIRSVQAYFEGLEAVGQLEIAKNTYNSLFEIRELIKNRYEQGIKSSLDLRLAETYLANSKVEIERNKVKLYSINRLLNIYKGKYPSSIFKYDISIPKIIPPIPKDMPIDIINRRPDIRAAIANYEASGMRVAQSKRNLLPGLAINVSGGTSAKDIYEILNSDYGIGSIGLSIITPIFSQGRLRSNVKLNESMQKDYEQSLKLKILNAFMEIEQLLYLDSSYTAQLDALKLAENQALDTYKLSKERYENGISPLEIVLNSQRQYNSSQSQYLKLKTQKLNNYLSLILALGGDMIENEGIKYFE